LRTVRDHYDRFLGPLYSWIIGDFDVACRNNVAYFRSLDLDVPAEARAVDLGAGSGCQSLPLADAGYEVLAVDFCQDLLDELEQRKGSRSIRTVCADVLDVETFVPHPVELIVCMGDTLVHLPDTASVERLLQSVTRLLAPGGTFVYAIRDYVDTVPQGADRFVPVRAEDDRIFTCFLDYREDVVHVHDILHRRAPEGWTTEISDYLKLRLDSRQLDSTLAECGLDIADRQFINGMITVAAVRPR